MCRKCFRQAICIILIFALSGCRSDYVLNLYSKPSGALVKVGEKAEGRTPCTIEIPRKSKLIKNHHIDVTYTLEDGREIVKSYDLRDLEWPKSTLRNTIAAALFVPGLLLAGLTASDEDDKYSPFDKEDTTEEERNVQLVAAGLIGLSLLIFDTEGFAYKHDIYETFENTD